MAVDKTAGVPGYQEGLGAYHRAFAAELRTMVADLENDALHHLLLPWPVGLELAVRLVERADRAEEEDDPEAPNVGRRLSQAFRAAGLKNGSIRTYAINRQAPLGEDERAYLRYEFAELRGRVADRLAPRLLARFDRLLGPDSPDALIDRPDFAMTIVDHVVRAVVD